MNHPLMRPSRHDHSQNSLYTDNSDDSDKLPVAIYPPPKQEIPPALTAPPKQTAPRLPEIKAPSKQLKPERILSSNFINDIEERAAVFNDKVAIGQAENEESAPKMPIFKHIAPSKPTQPSNILGMFRGFTSNKPPTTSTKRYSVDDRSRMQEKQSGSRVYQPRESMPLPTEQAANERMLRSSQGGRWLRSQSLTNEKQQQTTRYLIRHFHKHNSLMVPTLSRFIQVLEETENTLGNEKYRISLFESLQVVKLRMEAYLQSQVDLTNLVPQRPNAEWSQMDLTSFYTKYKPLLSKQASEKPSEHHSITLKKYRNCVYFGKMINGKKEGEGLLHYFNGKFFEGVFLDDQKLQGLEIDQKQLYLGLFKKGVRQGEGILKTSEALYVGVFYNGEFRCFPKHQQNMSQLSMASQHAQKGFEINHSRIKVHCSDMISVLKNSNGDIFVGNLNRSEEKDEQGLEIFANGDIYIGRYESGSPQGYGEYYWETGAFYRGQFLSGMRHGRGVWQMLNGDQYEGEYMNDKKNGKGVYVWKNGSKYVGSFQNDYRHGYGEMVWQDGRVYKGKWLNGIQKNTLNRLDSSQQQRLPSGTKTKMGKFVMGQNKGPVNRSGNSGVKPSFRTLQYEIVQNKKIPLEKLHAMYNPANAAYL